jgi:signal transduction histidine kinase
MEPGRGEDLRLLHDRNSRRTTLRAIYRWGEGEECDSLEDKLHASKTTIGWDVAQVHKNDAVVHVSLDIFPLFDEHGALVGNCVVGKETTRYRMLQSQLRRTQKLEAMGRLSGGIAHDFNNMLTVIAGYNNLITAELPAGDPMLYYCTQVDSAAQQATHLTKQLLAFSRREVTQPRVLSLNEMIEDLDKMLGRIVGDGVNWSYRWRRMSVTSKPIQDKLVS